MPGLNRRGFLAASAAGLGAATLAASGITTASAGSDDGAGNAARPGLTEAVLAAFRSHRLVGLGEEHSLQEHHDVLQTMLADPRLPGLVNDIVVENGNALYQDIVDAFVLAGKPVADADLRPVWRNTTQSPNEVLDAPVYEQLLRRVRAVPWDDVADIDDGGWWPCRPRRRPRTAAGTLAASAGSVAAVSARARRVTRTRIAQVTAVFDLPPSPVPGPRGT